MNIKEFINDLKADNIEVVLSGDDLKISYSEAIISDDLLQVLKSNKSEIIDFLKKDETSSYSFIPKTKQETGGFVMTPSQKRSWIISQNTEENFAYNMQKTYVFNGDLNAEALEDSFLDLIEQHESLRTLFKLDKDEEVKQFIKPTKDLGFKINCADYRKDNLSEEQIKELILEGIQKPFKLDSAPLIRCFLYRVEEDKWILLFVIHHIICDSRSMNVLIRDLFLLYKAHIKNEKNPLSPLRIQYKDFAIWKHERLKEEKLSLHKDYWLKELEGELPVLKLPTDRPRPAERTVSVGVIRKTIDHKVCEDFKSFCSDQGATLFTGLMSLFYLLFYRYTYQEDIIMGFPIYGRELDELEDQVGFYADTIALRAQFKGEDTFKELLANVNKKAFDAYEHRDYPFDKLVSQLNPRRDTSRNVLFDVLVVLQNFIASEVKESNSLGSLAVEEYLDLDLRNAAFDLTFNFLELKKGLNYEVEFNSGIYNRSRIEQLTSHFEQLMTIVLKYPERAISQLDFLMDNEKKQLLEFSNSDYNGLVNKKPTSTSHLKIPSKPLDFSLFYFGNKGTESNQYELLMDGAKYADKNGYAAIWTPERHFNEFGGPFPNPSVLGAALAAITENLSIRAGSVVGPLHHPVRIAEEWAVVDNLSAGRVGICFASGWNVTDFLLSPENYEDRHKILYERIKTIKELWQGNPINFKDGEGKTKAIKILPQPIQKKLPIWIASGGNIETFKSAGNIGAGILTGLLNTTSEELKVKIDAYRKAYKESGHEEGGDKVVLMLHTYIDENIDEVKRVAKKPLTDYLLTSLQMTKKLTDINLDDIKEEVKELLDHATNRYFGDYSLIGTIESRLEVLKKIHEIGVNEIACLVDFGIDYDATMKSLSRLTTLKNTFNAQFQVTPKNEKPDNDLETILTLFDNQVLKNPEATALIFQNQHLTYKQLDEQSNQLAHYLVDNGVVAENVIPVCISRSPEMVIALLGILKSGGVYMPIDHDSPKERIEFMIKDANAKVVLSESSFSNLFDQSNIDSFLYLDKHFYKNKSNEKVKIKVEPEDLAYIIYTSGSTGMPKGVMIEHHSFYNFFDALLMIFDDGDAIKQLSVTPLIFDVSLLEIFLPLISGGQLIISDKETSLDPELLKEYIARTNPTHIITTPSRWQLLLDAGWKNDEGVLILSGGESLSERLRDRLLHPDHQETVWNLYGPTETTLFTSITALTSNDKITVGSPIFNTQMYILSDELSMVPIGVIGEIHISGRGLARGYLNRPELTKEKFIANPFSIDPSSRLYKTGDLARWLPDGTIEFIGRNNTQVKIRGRRIELGEIEQAFQQLESVKDVVITVALNVHEEKVLVAYIISDEQLNISNLRNLLARRLPAYMIPGQFIQLQKFPLTVNGKVDRKNLPSPEIGTMETGTKYVAPRNEIEKSLIQIWQKVLGREKISIKDNFYTLGGDSLKITRITNYIHKEHNVKLSVLQFINNPTVETIANEIDKTLWLSKSLKEKDIEKATV